MEFPDRTYFQTTFYFYYNQQIATNVRTWQWVPDVAGQATNTAKVDMCFDGIDLLGKYQPLMVDGAQMQGIRYIPTPNPLNLAPVYSNTIAGAGTGGAVALPKQASALVRFKTLALGAKGENRIYVPFPPAAGNELTGVPNAAYIAGLIDLALTLAQPQACTSVSGAAGNIVPVLNIRRDTPLPPALIASGTAGHAWATQRRRGDYGKVNKSPFG